MKRRQNHGETHDTIAAIITPPGEGGIAAVRVAGPKAVAVLDLYFRPTYKSNSAPPPFLLRLGHFQAGEGEILDEVMAVYMPAGNSYTGLDQVEIFCHGGQIVVKKILETILGSPVRAAEPGEFTRLAFESGRIDLAKAEAVAEIIRAQTEVSFRASREHLLGKYSEHIEMLRQNVIEILSEVEAGIDFTDDAPEVRTTLENRLKLLDDIIAQVATLVESYQGGRIINEGYTIAIGGRPNAGKSSLFNLLLKHERALVTPTPGTTRDYLQERIDLHGYAVNLVDTAGLRQGGGKIEREGQRRAVDIISKADLLVWIVDLSNRARQSGLERDLKPFQNVDMLLLGNKVDIVRKVRTATDAEVSLKISCKTGTGLAQFKQEIIRRIETKMPDLTSGLVVTSLRHKQKLAESARHLKLARLKVAKSVSGELVAYDLRQATAALSEITGKVYTEQILGRIFSKFCIGK